MKTNEVKSALAGTRIFHAVKSISPGVINTHILSCFCNGRMGGVASPMCKLKVCDTMATANIENGP